MEYLTCAETAKYVRKALKESFPAIKFSVRSRTYSGGASIDVDWTDGPTREQVDKVVNPFVGSDFDGMTDSKTYRDTTLEGGKRSGADYILCQRHYSSEFALKVAQAYSRETGWDVPEIQDGWYVTDYLKPVPGGREPVARWFERKLYKTAEGETLDEAWAMRVF